MALRKELQSINPIELVSSLNAILDKAQSDSHEVQANLARVAFIMPSFEEFNMHLITILMRNHGFEMEKAVHVAMGAQLLAGALCELGEVEGFKEQFPTL